MQRQDSKIIMGVAQNMLHVVEGNMATQRCRTPTLSALWGSTSQSSTSTACAASESHSESGGEGSGMLIPAHHLDDREEQSSRVALYSDSSESEDDSVRSRMEQNCQPPCKKRKQSKLSYQRDWKWKYLMLPAPSSEGKLNDEMICVQCHQQMKAKSSTALRHISRRHPDMLSDSFSEGKKRRLLRVFEGTIKSQQSVMANALKPNELVKLAPYKLAFVLAKHKLPFSACEAFSEFARSADPTSSVFSQMACSRGTITKRTQEIHKVILKPLVVQNVNNSPYWSLICDESCDGATQEQLGLYVRYINLEKQKIEEEFFEMKRITGHPNADNLFAATMEAIDSEDTALKLPLDKLVALTTDGASVVLSEKGGLFGKLKERTNTKLFSTHCPPHRLVLASKAGQKELPNDIEKTISDTLFFFRDSSVRRDEFSALKEMVEPDSPYIAIVQYHRVRWLSLADCVGRLVKLLPLLVRYFEEQSCDTVNRVAVREKCRDLHNRLSEPRFQLFLYFLLPQLEALAKINKWLQSPNLSIHIVYSKIKALLSTFIEPVALDTTKSICDSSNLRPISDAIPLFPGKDFQEHYASCLDHSLMDSQEMQEACKSMYQYIVKIGESILKRFPEIDFIINNSMFLDPPYEKHA